MTTNTNERQQRFDDLRRRASQAMGLPIEHERVVGWAMRQLIYQDINLRYLGTGYVPSDLRAYLALMLDVEHSALPGAASC